MKYRYLYQTGENENREGEINAKNRAEAYAALRKRGIRPYRVIGDDPVDWKPWAASAAIVMLAGAVAFLGYRLAVMPTPVDPHAPMARQQVLGDPTIVAAGVHDGWTNVFACALDRHLAAYAQPGVTVRRPEVATGDYRRYERELAEPMARPEGERAEYRTIRNIVRSMRDEMSAELAAGKTCEEYFAGLDARQEREIALRDKAAATVERAPEDMKYQAWLGVNAKLREMGIAPLDLPRGEL